VVLGGTLYFRADAALRAEMAAAGSRPFAYAKATRTVTIGRFMSAPEADIDDPEALLAWARKALAAG
jgi:DNA transformation protein